MKILSSIGILFEIRIPNGQIYQNEKKDRRETQFLKSSKKNDFDAFSKNMQIWQKIKLQKDLNSS